MYRFNGEVIEFFPLDLDEGRDRPGLLLQRMQQPFNFIKLIIMSLLAALQPSTSASTSVTESVEVVISSLSAPISGKYGNFRQFSMNGENYNCDDSRCFNVNVFKPNCKATLTLQQYTDKEGIVKTVIAGLNIHLPEGSGLFIMK